MRSRKMPKIPDYVIDCVNKLIEEKWDGNSAKFIQDELIDLIIQNNRVSRDYLFDNRCLDVEDLYRGEGWIVTYDKPAYNESYKATFEFRKS